MGDEQKTEATETEMQDGKATATFTQADVDKIVSDRLAREREATKAKYADYNDLRAKAEGAKTAEDRIAELAKEVETTKLEALRRRVQAAHKISDEDADLFLTGGDLDTLTAQAKRLADRDAAREADRKKTGARAPLQGRTPTTTSGDPKTEATREWLRSVTDRD